MSARELTDPGQKLGVSRGARSARRAAEIGARYPYSFVEARESTAKHAEAPLCLVEAAFDAHEGALELFDLSCVGWKLRLGGGCEGS